MLYKFKYIKINYKLVNSRKGTLGTQVDLEHAQVRILQNKYRYQSILRYLKKYSQKMNMFKDDGHLQFQTFKTLIIYISKKTNNPFKSRIQLKRQKNRTKYTCGL